MRTSMSLCFGEGEVLLSVLKIAKGVLAQIK